MTDRCAKHCDFENAKLASRATWVCPDCGRDISIEYLYWAQVAHPEWFSNIVQSDASTLRAAPKPEDVK